MPPTLKVVSNIPSSNLLHDAHKVVSIGYVSVGHMLSSYSASTAARGRGAPSDEEQDLLRSAILFAGATVDSSLKHAIHACLEHVVSEFSEVAEEYRKFIESRLKSESQQKLAKELSQVFICKDVKDHFLSEFRKNLTGSSLQSVEQINKIWNLFSIGKLSKPDQESLREALQSRNQIVHELDIDLGAANRNRRNRRKNDCVKMCNSLLNTADRTIVQLDQKISNQD
jgi:hypothetical protein